MLADGPLIPDAPDNEDHSLYLERLGVRLLSRSQRARGIRVDRARIVARVCRQDAELLVVRVRTSIDGVDARTRVLVVEVREDRHRLLAFPAEHLDGLIEALIAVRADQ